MEGPRIRGGQSQMAWASSPSDCLIVSSSHSPRSPRSPQQPPLSFPLSPPPPPPAAGFFFLAVAASSPIFTTASFISYGGSSSNLPCNAAFSAQKTLHAQAALPKLPYPAQDPVSGERSGNATTANQGNSQPPPLWSGGTEKVDGFEHGQRKRAARKGIWLTVDDAAVEILTNKINSGEEAFQKWERPLKSVTIVEIIDGIRHWQSAYAFFEWLKAEDRHEISKYVYCVMLKTLRRGKQWVLCEKLVEEMISKGLEVDNITYSILISCAKRCYLPEMALKWYDRMLAAGCEPDQITCSSMIDVYGAAGQTAQAVGLYQRLRRTGWSRDPVAFGAMANVYAKVGNFKAIRRLFSDMKQLGFEPNVYMYTSYIQALCNADKPALAMDAFNQMKKAGVKPATVTLGILIEMHTRLGAVDDAFEVFKHVRQENLTCDTFICNALISACVENGLVKEAEGVFAEMEGKGPTPDEKTYRRMVSVYASAGRLDKAAEFLDKLLEKGYEPTIYFCWSLVKACREAQQYEKLPLFFEELLKTDYKADHRLLGVLLDCFGMCRESVSREKLLGSVRQISPNFHALVIRLLLKDTDGPGFGSDLKTAFDGIPEGSCRFFCNKLINMCTELGQNTKSHQLLEAGVSLGIYNIQAKSKFEWRLDLRGLSVAAAQCAVNVWVKSLSEALERDEPMPSLFVVATGMGKRRAMIRSQRGAADQMDQMTLNTAIPSLLKELDAPFEENSEAGLLVAPSSVVKSWLYSRKVSQQLV